MFSWLSNPNRVVRCSHAGGGKQFRILFHWEKSFIFMQIAVNLSFFLLQHGHHEHTLLFALVIVSQTTNLMRNRIDLALK